MIKLEQLIELGASHSNAKKYLKPINDTCIRYNINTEARICAYLCQIYEETGALSNVRIESLNYSAKRLMQVWPSRFPTLAIAQQYANNPTKLAEKVYGGRGGNPIGQAGKYIGRGMIQLTFYDNYKACGQDLGVDLVNHPELVSEPEYAVLSAGWFWNRAKCNSIADLDSLEAVKKVTKIVNGGYGNLEIRQNYWKKAKTIGFNIVSVEVKAMPAPLPNVVLPFEAPDAVIQHNPVVKPSLFSLFINFLTTYFKK